MKFKVGDKVRVVYHSPTGNYPSPSSDITYGGIGVVDSVGTWYGDPSAEEVSLTMVGKETRNRSWHQERKSWEGIIEAVEDAKTGGTKMKFEVTGRKTIAKFVQALNDANAELAKTPASVDSALLADEKKKTKALTETVDVLNQEIQNIKSNSLSLVPINEALRQTVSSLNAEAGKARDKHYALEQEINTLKSKMDNRLLVANALIGALARTSV
jgi:uncharacterized coiled-coil DUF342 family protein